MLSDLKRSYEYREIWTRMGFNEIRRAYRRTFIGPFWLTITMGLFIGTLGVLYSSFWNVDVKTYLPYLAAGFLIWIPITSSINEGCNIFINNEHIIKQINPPYSLFALALVYKHLILFLHHFVIYIILILLLNVPVNYNTIMLIPGIILLLINGIWVSMLIGLINTRYRDVQPLTGSIMQLLFFLTPIFWMPELVGESRKIFVDANPFYHCIKLVRDPLLGMSPELNSWLIVITITVFGWILTSYLFKKYEWRLAYWL